MGREMTKADALKRLLHERGYTEGSNIPAEIAERMRTNFAAKEVMPLMTDLACAVLLWTGR